MTVDEIVAAGITLLRNEERVSYRLLKRRFALDDDYLEDLKAELIDAKRLALNCQACGTPYAAGEKFCGECGAALAESQKSKDKRQK